MTMAASSSPRPPPPRPPPPPPPPPPAAASAAPSVPPIDTSNQNGTGDSSLTAAADLIKTLDSAFSEMSSLSANAAKDADDARRNARAASEVARRYTARSFPFSPENKSPRPISPTRKRKNTPRAAQGGNSSDLLAQSHAEDVLTLSMELERTKQELEMERREHDKTRMLYTEHRTKNHTLEHQMEKLLAEMEQKRQECRDMATRMEELEHSSAARVKAAEEDAQAALDLATEASESRQQLEGWLQVALDEVTTLREQVRANSLASPNKNVRFAGSPTIVTVPNRDGTMITSPTTPRSMVAAGRSLLDSARSPDHSDKVHFITLTPQKSAERRQRLRQRLQALDDETLVISPPRPPPPPRLPPPIMANAAVVIINLLQQSARSLSLPGRWSGTNDDVENLTRRYCSSVETNTKRQREEIKELSSLCGYLEEKLGLTNGNGATTAPS